MASTSGRVGNINRRHCCVPGCSNNAARNHEGRLSFHAFPKDEILKKQWLMSIRREEGPNFKITPDAPAVCSDHFLPCDMKKGLAGTRMYLKKGAVPSVFSFDEHEPNNRKSPKTLVMVSHNQLMTEHLRNDVSKGEEEDGRTQEQIKVKIEVDEAEEDWRTLGKSGQDTMHDSAEEDTCDNHHETDTGNPLAANAMSGSIRKRYTCQWIKTEPVEENETCDVFHQFQSDPNRKEDIKREFLAGVGLSCRQISSLKTGSFGQSHFPSPKQKVEPITDSESNSSRDAVPVYFSGGKIKVEVNSDSETDPDEERTSFSVNIRRPDLSNYRQTGKATNIKMTVTSMGEDEDMSSSDEQEYDPCPTIRQDSGLNTPATSDTTLRVKPFVCDECEKRFTMRRDLKRHMLTHSDHKPFMCDVCNKCFKRKSNLTRHVLGHTGQNKAFFCDLCDKTFTQKHSLKTHMLIHTGQKPFVCDVCKKGFIQSHDLKRHKLTHTGQKPFVCDTCKKSFARKSNLTQHKLIHTDST